MFHSALPFLVLFSLSIEAAPIFDPEIAALVAAFDANPDVFIANQANMWLNSKECPNYSECSQNGIQSWKDLGTVIRNEAQQDSLDPQLYTTFYRDYQVFPANPHQGFNQGMKTTLTEHHIDFAHLSLWGVRTPPSVQWPYANVIDTRNGAIISVANRPNLDPKKTLKWSEIVYQSWRFVQDTELMASQIYPGILPPGASISNLQHSVAIEVTEPGTLEVMTNIYNNIKVLGHVGDCPNIWRRFTVEDPDTRNWFYGLVGTYVVQGTMDLLKEHAVQIGRKQITAINTKWCGEFPDIWYVP